MQKSIKKIIAGAVSALMVISAMPLTALAAVGDYTPDIQLQFSSFYDADASTWGDDSGSSATCYQSSGLANIPLEYNATNGTLKATKADMDLYNEVWEEDPVDGDWELSEGDIFAVTVRMDNLTEAWGGQVNIAFSDNLEPAGLWQKGTGKKATYGFSSESGIPSGANGIVGYREPVADFSASELYEGMNDTVLGDLSAIEENAHPAEGMSDLMMSPKFLSQGESIDLSSVDPELGFFDIENHTYDYEDGYTYEGKAIMATFVFAITDDSKPIKFELQDPVGEYSETLDSAYVIVKKSDGTTAADKTTYAVNKYNLATMKNDGDVEHAGSTKMTFMGKNINRGEEPTTTYTVTFKDAKGDTISSTEYEEGATVTIPPLPENTYDDNFHYTYAWNAEPAATATADATYQVVETKAAHVYDEGVIDPEATCAAEGTKTFTCTCGKQYTEPVGKLAHTPAAAVRENEVPATCAAKGSYDEVVYCSVCNEELSRTTKEIEKVAHTPAAAVVENEVPATCAAKGSYDEVVYCSVCNEELSRTTKEIEKVAHTPAAAVKENEVAPTKEAKGSYDSVVYCSVCNEELSRDTIEIDALGVTITLGISDIGTVAGLKEGANKLAFGETYTVTATPVDGASFVGWDISGNIVSKDATYTGTAASDITITPVFEDAASDKITVTFYDKYGNTVKQYKDKTVAEYQAAIAVDYDTLVGPEYPSYTFKGWDKSKEEILAIAESATVWAQYDQALTTAYTVTSNAEIELPAGVVNGEIPYDTKVTVKDDNAKAWIVGNAIVAYGTEYTFYVGSDIEVQPVYDTVEEKATTTVVGANLVADSDYKFNIVATRNIPDGYELVDYGFVYGKNLTDADLDLDKVGQKGSNDDSGDVKAVHAGTRNLETNEFAMNYGIKAKNAPVTAKSFVTVVKGDETEIVYSDMFVQNY